MKTQSSSSLKDQWVHSTVRIECTEANGVSSGTAFLFRFDVSPGRIVEALVTNKHVVEGAKTGKFCLTLTGGNGEPQDGNYIWFGVPHFEKSWIPHPDPNVDLCVMPFYAIREAAKQNGDIVFLLGIGEDALPSPTDLSHLGAVCDVFMIGYPDGLWDSKNNRPLVRRGIAATDPKINYQGEREFLIDAACFPGSSGSPVFGFCEDIVTSKQQVLRGEHIHLLGVLYAGPQHTVTGQLDGSPGAKGPPPVVEMQIPNHLGYATNWSCLLDFKPLLKPTRHVDSQ